MEYIYLRNKKKWYNVSEMAVVNNFDSKENKNRIKCYNTYAGINNGAGFSYMDLDDARYIWRDGTVFYKYTGNHVSGSGNRKPDFILNKNILKKAKNVSPANCIEYIEEYIHCLLGDYQFKLNDIKNMVKKHILSRLDDEALIAYELNKDRIEKELDDYCENHPWRKK